ncbi:MAG: phosphoribosylamine--glycine ligase [Cyanobacteria bacterium P01_A01_bin.84]
MRVLVIGNGGREHAIAWSLLQSQRVQQVVCVPGNGGTASMKRCQNLPLKVNDFENIAQFAQNSNISFIVVGPEIPLAQGIADYLQSLGIPVFGPCKAGAQIESSKAWAKAFMQEAGIPTAVSAVFTDADSAKSYINSQGVPIVVKADGLAAGKGVIVAETLEKANFAVDAMFSGQFGSAGKFVVIEEFLPGQEVSVLAITDGITIRALLPAQDHKRVGEGDTGDNTGGMGAYAPAPIATSEIMEFTQNEILEKAIATFKNKNIDYRGVLYAGLMISPQGEVKVLEFNCRFGDPETQVILPLLETPLEELMLACIEQRLADMPSIKWKNSAAATVVAASGGYPGNYHKGKAIAGIEKAKQLNAIVFHAGTKLDSSTLVTDGGRVLNVTGIGIDFKQALTTAYEGIKQIEFEGMYFRGDIGYRVMGNG